MFYICIRNPLTFSIPKLSFFLYLNADVTTDSLIFKVLSSIIFLWLIFSKCLFLGRCSHCTYSVADDFCSHFFQKLIHYSLQSEIFFVGVGIPVTYKPGILYNYMPYSSTLFEKPSIMISPSMPEELPLEFLKHLCCSGSRS